MPKKLESKEEAIIFVYNHWNIDLSISMANQIYKLTLNTSTITTKRSLLEITAKNGYVTAMCRLGRLHWIEKPGCLEGLLWYQQAAERNNASACKVLSSWYFHHENNLYKGLKWACAAFDKGIGMIDFWYHSSHGSTTKITLTNKQEALNFVQGECALRLQNQRDSHPVVRFHTPVLSNSFLISP